MGVTLQLEPATHSVAISSVAVTVGQTGVEMEALTSAAVAALTVYDMVKVRGAAYDSSERGWVVLALLVFDKQGMGGRICSIVSVCSPVRRTARLWLWLGRAGVEVDALTSAAGAALTVYDMVKVRPAGAGRWGRPVGRGRVGRCIDWAQGGTALPGARGAPIF